MTTKGLTGLAAQILEAEKRYRIELMKADDAGSKRHDDEPAVAGAADALHALTEQIPKAAGTLDAVLARGALLYTTMDETFYNPEHDWLKYAPTRQAFDLLKAIEAFAGVSWPRLGDEELRLAQA